MQSIHSPGLRFSRKDNGVNHYEIPPRELISLPGRKPPSESPHGWSLILISTLSALPISFVAVLYTSAARAAVYLGHWPSYGNPDPKDLPEHFSPPEILELIVPALILCLLTTAVAAFIARYVSPSLRLLIAWSIAVSCWLLSFALIFADPLGVVEWMMD
jgi:hypothetical protein